MATKPDCKYYDWGDTAPREYGAFCRATHECLTKEICENCKTYKKKVKPLTEEEIEELTQAKADGRL